MKIGLLVDGRAEYYALPHLLPRLGSPHQVLAPLFCDIQPFASPAQMALAASKRFPILLSKGAEAIAILIDKETRPDCTGELVQAVEREALARLKDLSPVVKLWVVFKVSMFENWLVADTAALRGLPGLFQNVARIEKQVSNGRADSVNALDLLKTSSKRSYDKVDSAIAICKGLDPVMAAENSRSFRSSSRFWSGVREDRSEVRRAGKVVDGPNYCPSSTSAHRGGHQNRTGSTDMPIPGLM